MSASVTKNAAQTRATIDTHRLANISRRLADLAAEQAQLLSEQARIFEGMSQDSREVRTGRRVRRSHVPEPVAVSDDSKAAAERALRNLEKRRRERR